MNKHDVKIYQSGKVIEIIRFGKPIYKDIEDKPPPAGRAKEASEEDKILNRARAVSKARKELRRLVGANDGQWNEARGRPYKSVFLTLTFADEVQDSDTANHEFKLFMMRLGNVVNDRKHRNSLKYAVVPEIQEKRLKKYGVAVWHYHVIIFNLPFTPWEKIKTAWGKGAITINAIDHVDNVGAYISKYMRDHIGDRTREKKSYFTSRGLYKPIKFELDTTHQPQKEMLESVCKTAQALAVKKPFVVTHESDYFDLITYTQYTLKDQ